MTEKLGAGPFGSSKEVLSGDGGGSTSSEGVSIRSISCTVYKGLDRQPWLVLRTDEVGAQILTSCALGTFTVVLREGQPEECFLHAKHWREGRTPEDAISSCIGCPKAEIERSA